MVSWPCFPPLLNNLGIRLQKRFQHHSRQENVEFDIKDCPLIDPNNFYALFIPIDRSTKLLDNFSNYSNNARAA